MVVCLEAVRQPVFKGKRGEVLAGVRKEMNFVCRVIGPVTGQSQSQPALI